MITATPNCAIWFFLCVFIRPFYPTHNTNTNTNTRPKNISPLHLSHVLPSLPTPYTSRQKHIKDKVLQMPNICYIFLKAGAQGYQIWPSHVSHPCPVFWGSTWHFFIFLKLIVFLSLLVWLLNCIHIFTISFLVLLRFLVSLCFLFYMCAACCFI